MNEWYILLLIGLISGVFAGLGMGGGTFLIPLLSICLGVYLREAQAINLISFVPMGIVAVVIQSRRKMINFKKCLLISISAIICSYISSKFSNLLNVSIAKRIFGVFILSHGVFQVIKNVFWSKCAKTRETECEN